MAPDTSRWRSDAMIVRTDAIVLRAFDYGETSQIVTLLTRQHGVLGVMAKGSRRPSSRFGSTLQPTSYIQAVYYYRTGRGLQTLSETTHLARFSRLRSDLERITMGLRAIEVARLALDEGDAHPLALEALARTLTFLDASEDNAGNALPWFQLRMAGLLGFSPDIQRDDILALGDRGRLILESGAVLAEDPPAGVSIGQSLPASRAALRAFAILARTDLETAGRMRMEPDVRGELQGLVDAYLRVHAESAFPERVQAVRDDLEAGLDAARPDQRAGE